jgi:hypothetical protein
MAASQDEEIQKKGVVGVVVNMGDNHESLHLEVAIRIPGLANSIPIRWAGVHFW